MNVTSPSLEQGNLSECAEQAAVEAGVRLHNLRDSGKRGIAFTLKTGEPTETETNHVGRVRRVAKYRRVSQHEVRCTASGHEGEVFHRSIPGAVCWHGHRDFLRALYLRVPDARVKTAMAVYQSAAHFEATYKATEYAGGKRMGYPMTPYSQACSCEEV